METAVYTEEDVIRMLLERCKPTAAAFSQETGVSKVRISRVLAGMEAPGPGILMALGLRKVVTYQKAA